MQPRLGLNPLSPDRGESLTRGLDLELSVPELPGEAVAPLGVVMNGLADRFDAAADLLQLSLLGFGAVADRGSLAKASKLTQVSTASTTCRPEVGGFDIVDSARTTPGTRLLYSASFFEAHFRGRRVDSKPRSALQTPWLDPMSVAV